MSALTVKPSEAAIGASFRSERKAESPELTVVIPTFNEAANVGPLVGKLKAALRGIHWEAIFVDDDSTDGTPDVVLRIAGSDARVRLVRRFGRRGLSTACVEGVFASTAPVVAVIDGDMQHDEHLLPSMLELLKGEQIDIVVGSRYIEGGSLGDWSGSRKLISRTANRIAQLVVRAELTDPMSGFFMARRSVFEQAVRRLSGQGFKILVDLFASSPAPLRFRELPYKFRLREHGESKLDSRVAGEYLLLVLDKLVGHIVPVRFVLFAIVGGIGVAVHLTTRFARAAGVETNPADFAGLSW